jgi:hypothetical protein
VLLIVVSPGVNVNTKNRVNTRRFTLFQKLNVIFFDRMFSELVLPQPLGKLAGAHFNSSRDSVIRRVVFAFQNGIYGLAVKAKEGGNVFWVDGWVRPCI